MIYIIDYGLNEIKVDVEELQEAKEIAVEGMGYTGQSVTIKDKEGNEITRSEWFGVDGNDEEHVLVQIGSSGYYQTWSDELENI